MSSMVKKRLHQGQLVTVVSVLALLPVQALAQSPYVDTSKLKPHVHMGPPPIITAPSHIMGRAEHQFKQIAVENTPGAADKVAKAKKSAKISAGIDGSIKTVAAQAGHRGAEGFLMGSLRKDHAGAYKGDDGEKLQFGYDRTMGQFVAGMTPNASTELKFVGVMDRLSDDKQPHHPMDPNTTNRHVGKGFLTLKNVAGLDTLQLHGTGIDLHREADNYSLRSNAGTKMRVNVDREIFELGATGTFKLNGFENAVGVSVKRDDHNAQRFNVTAGDVINSYRFPGVEQTGLSLWGDSKVELQKGSRAKLGLRYDYLTAEATKGNVTPTTGNGFFDQSASALYSTYYGVNDTEVTDHNISAKVKLEQDLSISNGMLFGEIGRMVRTPSNIERWHALSGPTAGRWIGNPNLNPEKHYKAEIGVEFKGDGYKAYQRSKPEGNAWKTKFSAYYDKVNDFISLDKARGQSGVLQSDGATVSRNVDATLIGGSAEFEFNINRNLSSRLVATYTYGDNDTDNRPLYQVRPYEAYWLLDYTDDVGVAGTWNVGSKVRFSGRQDRLDDDNSTALGMDNDGVSGAFTTLDLYGGLQLYNQVGISLGIDNVFDKHYNEHVTGEHVASTTKSAVTAPGRTFFVRAVANF